jgi:hypothetical protein
MISQLKAIQHTMNENKSKKSKSDADS